jgi:tetratricopeptide (TPR) repeat protein
MPLEITDREGKKLADYYKIFNMFPVFVLTNSKGEIIARWTGYTNSRNFVTALGKALSDSITLKNREERMKIAPNINDAIFLAKYYYETKEFLKAVEYYRLAQEYGKAGTTDYSLEIFQSMASAAWDDLIAFEDILPALDDILNARQRNLKKSISAVKLLGRVARRKNLTDQLPEYLERGLQITANSNSDKTREEHLLFQADYALYVSVDTAKSIRLKKQSLGPDWENRKDRYYDFARWCLERNINLEQAESYAWKTARQTSAGDYGASVLNTLAGILHAQGKSKEAVNIITKAIEQAPDNDYYKEQLELFRSSD